MAEHNKERGEDPYANLSKKEKKKKKKLVHVLKIDRIQQECSLNLCMNT